MATDEELATAVQNEGNRCIAWCQYARSRGETDMRQVIHWIETGEWPEEESD